MLSHADLDHYKVALASDVVMASASMIAVTQTVAASAAFATVLVAWIKSRASRKIIITTSDNKVFHAEGYSVAELEEIMLLARRVDVIDTKPLELSGHDTGT